MRKDLYEKTNKDNYNLTFIEESNWVKKIFCQKCFNLNYHATFPTKYQNSSKQVIYFRFS